MGNAAAHGIAPVVLLVLAGRHAGVVRGDDDKRAAHAGVGDREERVGGDIEPHMLHRHQRPAAARRPRRSPPRAPPSRWAPTARARRGATGLEDLRGGRSGVTGAQRDSGVEGGECRGFVAAEQLAGGGGHCLSPVPASARGPPGQCSSSVRCNRPPAFGARGTDSTDGFVPRRFHPLQAFPSRKRPAPRGRPGHRVRSHPRR